MTTRELHSEYKRSTGNYTPDEYKMEKNVFTYVRWLEDKIIQLSTTYKIDKRILTTTIKKNEL